MIYGIPGFKLEKHIVLRRWRCWKKAACASTSASRSGAICRSPNCARGTTRC